VLVKILIGVVVVIVILAIVVATRPAAFHLQRSTTIAAPAEVVFERVNDFHAWGDWSPWEKMDPQMARTFGGPPAGEGSTYAWSGNSKVGEGKMTIERSERPGRVVIKLEFLRPMRATNTATFTFASAPGGGTAVTWAMDGNKNFMAKAIHMVMDFDKLVGADFERGLAALKTISETKAVSGTARAID
jgi:uncharacterized protein YndB with AHSA1/START domain